MKKLFLTAAVAVIIAGTFSSCQKCEICTKNSSPEVKLCEKDYSNTNQYNLAVDGYGLLGYNCKKAI